jgi:uncharacterized membrane protein YczE
MPRIVLPVPVGRRPYRFAQLAVGLLLYGISTSMLVLARLGLDPWDVLHQGLSHTFGMPIGTWAIIVSFAVLVCWWPLRLVPGIGTFANAVAVGLVMDVVLSTVQPPHVLTVRIAMLLAAVMLNGIATGLYIGAGMGAGARDGLSVGLAAHGYSMRIVRTSVELTVLIAGVLLGGTFGVGTVLYAVTIGPLTHRMIPALAMPSAPNAGGCDQASDHPDH